MKKIKQYISGKPVALLTEHILKGHLKKQPLTVDLGLPSGTLWCTCNLGANKPEEFGDKFAFGEIEPKDIFLMSNYKYDNYITSNATKYNVIDDKEELMLEDDAAYNILGKEYYIPDIEQYNELLKNTTQSFTEYYNDTNVKGWILTSKINNETLFFPLTGIGNKKDKYDNNHRRGAYGTANIYNDDNDAISYSRYFIINFSTNSIDNDYDLSRRFGTSIRAVKNKR